MSTVTATNQPNNSLVELIQLTHRDGGWEAVRELAKELEVDKSLELAFAWQDAIRAAGLA